MSCYILLGLVIIVLGILTNNNVTNRKLFLLFSVVVLSMFAGLRGEFTSDHASYNENFLYIDQLSFTEIFTTPFVMERGFIILSRIIGIFTDSTVVYTITISFITIILYLRGLNESKKVWLAVLLFVCIGDYFASFNISRQVLSSAFCFAAMPYIEKRKPIKYYLLVVFAMLIHQTAIIMLPMYFLLKIKINKRNLALYLAFTCFSFLFLTQIIEKLVIYFPRYQNYSWGMFAGTVNSIVALAAILLFALFSILFIKCDFNTETLHNRIIVNAAMWCFIFGVLGIQVFMISRFVCFFRPCMLLLATDVIDGYRIRTNQTLIIILVAIFSLLYLFITLSGTGYDPYYTIFS